MHVCSAGKVSGSSWLTAKPALDTSIHTTGIFVRRTLEDFDIPDDCLGPAVRDVTLYSPSRRRPWISPVNMMSFASAEWAACTRVIWIIVCAPGV